MRNLLISTGLALLAASGCNESPDALKDPPVLKVTSPTRSLIRGQAGSVTVTGTVAPNAESGEPITKVLVNNVQATVSPDGAFTATINVFPGATLIHTTARDAGGAEASDTRAMHAGELRPVGGMIENSLTAAVSPQAFAKLSAAAGPMIETVDMGAMLAPMQPMVHAGDEAGPDCLYGRLFVDDVTMRNVDISLIPTNAGLQFRAQIDGLAVPGHANYAAACVDGSNTLNISASRVVVSGILVVEPRGNQGFATSLTEETVTITGLDIEASGIPGSVIDLLSIDTAVGYIVSKAAPLAMEPMLNKALGGFDGPQQFDVMGKSLTIEVDPTAIDIAASGAYITLSTKALIGGAAGGPGYVFTDNGLPAMDPGTGLQLGLADDLANTMMAQFGQIGMLNIGMEAHGGTFDRTDMAMTLPPMISADPVDGKMKVIIGDMISTFSDHGTPVAKAAINASIDLKVVPANNGYGVALELGTPTVYVTTMDDIANVTQMSAKDLSDATEVSVQAQVTAISKLLVNIPIPSVMGVQMRNVQIGSDDGYVMVKADVQ